MWLKIMGAGILAFLLVALELSGISGSVNGINLIAAALIFLIYYDHFWESVMFAGVSGLLLDFFSTGRFGTFLAGFIIFAIILNVVIYNFFSTKNWMTLAIFSLSGMIIYNLTMTLVRVAIAFNFMSLGQNWSDKILGSLLTFSFIMAVYFIFGRLKFFKKIRQ